MNTRGARRWSACLFALVALSWATAAWALTPPAVVRLENAVRIDPQSPSEPVNVTLPDNGLARDIQGTSMRTYQLSFSRADLEAAMGAHGGASAAMAGLYIERACTDATVRLNGVLVHRSPAREFNRFRDCYEPQLIALPWPLIRVDLNELEVQIEGWPLAWVSSARRAIGLSEIMLGDFERLKPLHQREMALSAYLPAVTSGALLLLGLLILCLFAFAPRDPHLAFFAALSILWAAINARGWWSVPVDDVLVREGTLVVMTSLAAWAFQRFVCLYADLQVHWLERLGRGQALAMPVLVVLAGSDHLFLVGSLNYMIAGLLVAAGVLLFLVHASEPRRRPMRGLSAVFLLGLVLVLLELGVALGLMDAHASLPLRWGVPLCLVMIGALQMMQFGRQAQQVEVIQRQLEQKIEMARQEIEANFHRLAEARIEQVTAGERKRIAADLHDDLGAKLLTIVHTSRSDRIAALGREALDEMRLSVRGLTGRPMELSEALADWRTEAMGRLAATGIELDWPLPLQELPQVLGARAMVQTTRILREVFNNLIRHSQATACVVRTEITAEQIIIDIRDNGGGFELERLQASKVGLGLLSMQHRARQLKGDCLIDSRPGEGSRTRLSLPLEAVEA